MRIETRSQAGKQYVDVYLASIPTTTAFKAIRRYMERTGKPARGRPGWRHLTWRQWQKRPGVLPGVKGDGHVSAEPVPGMRGDCPGRTDQ